MSITKTKPDGVVKSGIYDHTRDRYWLFAEDGYELTDITLATIQAAIDSGALNLVEVYDVAPTLDGVLKAKIGNRNRRLGAGEQTFLANVKAECLLEQDFSYYSDRGVFVISENNCIRTYDGLKAIPLNDVYNVEKSILNDGATVAFNQLEINIDGIYANEVDETNLPFSATALVAKTS